MPLTTLFFLHSRQPDTHPTEWRMVQSCEIALRRLTQPDSIGAWSTMPTFAFSETEAKDVAAFLLNTAESSDAIEEQTPAFKADDADAGRKLLLTTGCIVCHAMSQMPAGFEPQAAPYHGPDLSNVSERRDASWLTKWLKSPKAINPDHRMPIFALTENEQRQIVAALSQPSGNTAITRNSANRISYDAAAITRGRAIVANANCSACHKIPGLESSKAHKLRPKLETTHNAGHNCIATAQRNEIGTQSKLPYFRLNDIQLSQIKSWLSTLNGNLPTATEFVRGELLLQRNGCLACHDRDQHTGISALASAIESKRDDLRGQSQAMIPPPLTAVGDRLQDDYLIRAVAGEQKERRLPWLMIRMPQFEMSAEDRKSLVRYFVGSDSMQLRQWTIGEFARQRTEGKSWLWEMAGVTLLQSKEDLPFVTLVNTNEPDASALSPIIDQRRQAELLSYHVDEDSVTLQVQFHFDSQPADSSLHLELPTHSSMTAWNNPERPLIQTILKCRFKPISYDSEKTGWAWNVMLEDCPEPYAVQMNPRHFETSNHAIESTVHFESPTRQSVPAKTDANESPQISIGESVTWKYVVDVTPTVLSPPAVAQTHSVADVITSMPGFHGHRLPISAAIMPTGIAWLSDGRMVTTSLRGDVWIVSDTDKDGLPDSPKLYADGLSAPYGIQVDGNSIIVAHKPEVLRLNDTDGDGRADQFNVIASGWGFSDDYHDWTTALVKDRNGDLFVGLGSDYSQNKRPADNDRWRGTILKIDSNGSITPLATAFRFPMGLAFDHNQNLFVTDNQGVQNTFNEINHVIAGKHYGVPSRHEEATDVPPQIPAIMVPHPWTRSVNSILFFPDDFTNPQLAGHGVGCEYDTRCLIRFTIQEVNGVQQGASYRFSQANLPGGGGNFVGPIASAIGPDGALYIGSIWDSGWQGGSNTGSIERMISSKDMPNGIREIRATPKGFDVSFFHAFKDSSLLTDVKHWSIQGYTRHWSGSYATPDSERYTLVPDEITLSDDRKTAIILAKPLKAGFVYEIGINDTVSTVESLWPAEGFYSMKAVPTP